MILATAQIFMAFAIPVAILWLERRSKIVRTLSPVILCYLVGMLLGNQPLFALRQDVALHLCGVMVAVAVPLLLFSVDVMAWLRLARTTVLSFLAVMVLAMISSLTAHLLLQEFVPESAEIAGMLVGVYVGITANMAAIGAAAEVSPEVFPLLNAADMVISLAYLLFITMVAPRWFGRVLKPFPRAQGEVDGSGDDDPADSPVGLRFPGLRSMALNLGLSLGVVAAAAGVLALMGLLSETVWMVVGVTTLAVALSFVPRVRSLPGTQDMGQFFFLVFCVSMGFTTDFVKLFSASPLVVVYCGVVVVMMTVLFLPVAALLRVDRDTAIITHVAGVFGPHMIAPVAMVLKNREVIFSGIKTALVGIALGNYLGLGLIWVITRVWG
jgi:uncharacterized membrane protein